MVSVYFENMASYDEDGILIDRFIAGERTAFESLYEKYYSKVFSLAKGVLILDEEAADVTQEVFTLVYRNLGRFNRQSKFSTWLFRIAINRSIQESRKRRFRHKHVELTEAIDQVAPETIHESDPRIQRSLEMLTPQDRAILTLFYWQEQTLLEISESMDINLNAAKTRLYRARERFRHYFELEATDDSN